MPSSNKPNLNQTYQTLMTTVAPVDMGFMQLTGATGCIRTFWDVVSIVDITVTRSTRKSLWIA